MWGKPYPKSAALALDIVSALQAAQPWDSNITAQPVPVSADQPVPVSTDLAQGAQPAAAKPWCPDEASACICACREVTDPVSGVRSWRVLDPPLIPMVGDQEAFRRKRAAIIAARDITFVRASSLVYIVFASVRYSMEDVVASKPRTPLLLEFMVVAAHFYCCWEPKRWTALTWLGACCPACCPPCVRTEPDTSTPPSSPSPPA